MNDVAGPGAAVGTAELLGGMRGLYIRPRT